MCKRFVKIVCCSLLISTASFTVHAKSNSHGNDSPVLVGTVTKVLDNGDVLVKQKAGGHERQMRLAVKSKVLFNYFKGAGLGEVKDPGPGYVVKARVSHKDVIDHASNVVYVPPLPESKPIANREKFSEKELFVLSDLNENVEVDYVEYSICIARSEKHFAAGFGPSDKDKSETLSDKEFAEALTHVAWWKWSRHPASHWLKQADKDGNGELNADEFKMFSGKANHFKRTDKDRSSGVSTKELSDYLNLKQLDEE